MTFFLRILLCYTLINLVFRVIGKKPMEYMTNYDMALVIIIGNVISETISVSSLTISTYTLIFFVFIILVINYIRSIEGLRKLIDGNSKIVIEKGEVNHRQLRKAKLTVEELMERLRTRGYSNPSQIEYAIVEVSGYINIIPRPVKEHSNLQEGA